jgi:hypothetical protein
MLDNMRIPELESVSCLNCFCDPTVHDLQGCTTPDCRCDQDPYQATESKQKVRSCQDCPFFVPISGTGVPIVVINEVTSKKSVDRGQGGYWYCNRGYWGGMMRRDPFIGKDTIPRRATGFLQDQASLCADFVDESPLCTSCHEEPAKYYRDKKASFLCWPCCRYYDRETRETRLRGGYATFNDPLPSR